MKEWISVKDRLPDPEKDRCIAALIISRERNFETGNLETLVITRATFPGRPLSEDVTHWIALPYPPISLDEIG